MRSITELDHSLQEILTFGSPVSREYQRQGRERKKVFVRQKDIDRIMHEYATFGINAIDNTFLHKIVGSQTRSVQRRICRVLNRSRVLVPISDHTAHNNTRYYLHGTEPKEPQGKYILTFQMATEIMQNTENSKQFCHDVELIRNTMIAKVNFVRGD